MKNLKNILGVLFLALAVVGSPIHGAETAWEKIEASVKRVDKEMSLLDHIIKQANVAVDSTDQKARAQAKRNLDTLMKSKDLDENIKDAIQKDITTIKNPITKRQMYAARISLLNTYAKINTQANVVEAIAHATEMVENASPEELDEVFLEAKEMIEKAEEEQQGIVGRWYAKAKRMVTAPVDYIFGQESSYAKTAFYAVAGAALLAAGAYAASNYMGGGVLEEPGLPRKVRSLWTPKIQAFLKEEFGDDPEAQTAGLARMLPALEAKKLELLKSDEQLKNRIAAVTKEREDFIAQTPMREDLRQFFLYGGKITTNDSKIRDLLKRNYDLNEEINSLQEQKNNNFIEERKIDEYRTYYDELNYYYPEAHKQQLAKEPILEETMRHLDKNFRQMDIGFFLRNTVNEQLLKLSTEEILSQLEALENEFKKLSGKDNSIADQIKTVTDGWYLVSANRDRELNRLQDEMLLNKELEKKLDVDRTLLKYVLEERGIELPLVAAETYEAVDGVGSMKRAAEPQPREELSNETSLQKENTLQQPEEKIVQVQSQTISVEPEEKTIQSEEKSAAEIDKTARLAKIRADKQKKRLLDRRKRKKK